MRGAWIVVAFALGGLGSAVASCGSSTFACTDDPQCQSDAAMGTCQPNGYCSFPDDGCASGQRFGDAAPPEVAGECVEAEGGSDTGSTTATTGVTVAGTMPDPSQGLDSTTFDPADSSTTVAVDDDGTTTGPSITTGLDTDEPSGGIEEGCTVTIVDEFEGEALDPMWSPWLPRGGVAEVQDGELWLTIPPSTDYVTTRVVTELGVVAGGWARLRLDAVDDPLPNAGLILSNELCELQVFVNGQAVHAFVWSQEMQAGIGYAGVDLPSLPVTLQLAVHDDGHIHFEHSQDGATWSIVLDDWFPLCGDLTQPLEAQVFLGAGPTEGAVQSFQRFEACLPAQ